MADSESLETLSLKEFYSPRRYIYKRFLTHKQVKSLADMESSGQMHWFALTSKYGIDSYGPIVHTYEIKETPRLINVGSNAIRTQLRNKAEAGEGKPLGKEFNPDQQWSGGKGNLIFSLLVWKYFHEEYDGTIVVSEHPDTGDDHPATDEDNYGATEIVLWKDYTRFLRSV